MFCRIKKEESKLIDKQIRKELDEKREAEAKESIRANKNKIRDQTFGSIHVCSFGRLKKSSSLGIKFN